MLSVIQIARHSCRGSSLQHILRGKSSVLRSSQNLLKKTDLVSTSKCLSPFSTSQIVKSEHADHSHSQIWTAERFLSGVLVGILPLGLAFPNPVLDYALALALTAHIHWGVEAIVVDYVRPSVVGATLSRVGLASVYALSVLTLGGLFYFNYSDVGLCQAIRMLWKL